MKPALNAERPVYLVDDEKGFRRCLDALDAAPRVGVDTEANSFHAYRERVCLIQAATSEAEWIVDPLSVDVTALGDLFRDEQREVVFHAAEFDIASLKRSFGFSFCSLFDTQVAAMLLGMGQLGYSALVKQFLDLDIKKGQQRSDWGRRPLNEKQISYAAADVRYLLTLRERLGRMLESRGRLGEAQSLFSRLAEVRPHRRVFDPEGFYRIKGYRDLDPPGRAVARALYLAREKRAQKIDRAPFRVLGNEVLMGIADQRPIEIEQLNKIKGIPADTRREFSRGILGAVKMGLGDLEPPPPKRARRTESAVNRGGASASEAERMFDHLRAWRNRVSVERGIDSQLVLRNELLREIARRPPEKISDLGQFDGMDVHAIRSYGSQILRVLQEVRTRK